jgi:hypothetical protein
MQPILAEQDRVRAHPDFDQMPGREHIEDIYSKNDSAYVQHRAEQQYQQNGAEGRPTVLSHDKSK